MGLSIFKEYKLKNKNQKTCLDSLIDIKKGKNPEELFTDSSSERIRYLNMDAFSQNTFTYVNRSKQVLVDEFDYSMVMDGSSSGKIVFGLSGAIASTLGKIEVQNENFKYLVFFALKEIENGHKDHNTGSAIPHANKSLVKGIEITYSDSSLKGINGKLLEIFTSIVRNKKEMNQLQGVKLLLLTRLSSQQ